MRWIIDRALNYEEESQNVSVLVDYCTIWSSQTEFSVDSHALG